MQKRGQAPRFFGILNTEIKFKNKKIHYVVRKKDKTGSRYTYKLDTYNYIENLSKIKELSLFFF